jgi:hypothetical protein
VRFYYENHVGGISVGKLINGDDVSLMWEYHDSEE